MKIIIDECLPKRVTHFFESGEAYTVPQVGLSGYRDTELLNELEAKRIDVFVTIDGNIEYQQQFKDRVFGTVIIRAVSNRFSDLSHLKDKVVIAVNEVTSGEIKHIS
ncbi:MAG TPA: hypothetical protein EYG95_03290 [Campylobacterales bacterium]|nr:hypothetical protein [Campylobacterales bacterium]